jgi:hypothetical protein
MRLSLFYLPEPLFFEVKTLDLISDGFQVEDNVIIALVIILSYNLIASYSSVVFLLLSQVIAGIFKHLVDLLNKGFDVVDSDGLVLLEVLVLLNDDR